MNANSLATPQMLSDIVHEEIYRKSQKSHKKTQWNRRGGTETRAYSKPVELINLAEIR